MAGLPHLLQTPGFAGLWAYIGLFVVTSLIMMWRLEAMLEHGLEGTALGTIVMPYCSGLGNLIFVYLVLARHGPVREVLTNCLVNNVTNLTLLLGLPAVLWGLTVVPDRAPAGRSRSRRDRNRTEQQINRLSLLLTLAAVVFFTGAVWVLARDGRLREGDGLMLVGLFLFWQCFQVFDVLKHNVRRKHSFGPGFYLDVAVVLACAYGVYASLDWLVAWLGRQHGSFINPGHLGWLSGWLMVVPNALLAFYWGWKHRPDVVYTSQVGDGHICIPLCIGLCAAVRPVPITGLAEFGLLLLIGAAVLHALFLLVLGGLPRWAGWLLIAVYGWYLYRGLLA